MPPWRTSDIPLRPQWREGFGPILAGRTARAQYPFPNAGQGQRRQGPLSGTPPWPGLWEGLPSLHHLIVAPHCVQCGTMPPGWAGCNAATCNDPGALPSQPAQPASRSALDLPVLLDHNGPGPGPPARIDSLAQKGEPRVSSPGVSGGVYRPLQRIQAVAVAGPSGSNGHRASLKHAVRERHPGGVPGGCRPRSLSCGGRAECNAS
jgi:hypothetical protein